MAISLQERAMNTARPTGRLGNMAAREKSLRDLRLVARRQRMCTDQHLCFTEVE